MAAKRATSRKGRKTPPPVDPRRQIVDAAMRLAALQGWRDTRLSDIAEEAGIEPAELRRHYASKSAVLAGLVQLVDEAVLAGTDPHIGEEPVKDRLFDLIMRRLDALQPWREGVHAVIRELPADPCTLARLASGPLRDSMNWMLEAAQIRRWGPLAPLQTKGLAVVYLSVLRVWLRDDSEDKSRTMAQLDKALGRVDSLVGMLHRGPLRRRADKGEAEPDTAAG